MKTALIILGIIAAAYITHAGITLRILGAHFSIGF